MIKFIIKSVLLVSVIAIVLSCLGKYAVPAQHYMNTVNDYNALIEENKEIDIAIYGSSHAYCSFNPRIIDSVTKTRSFNFGNDAQRLIVTDYVLKESFKNIKPKVVVLDLFSSTIKNSKKENILALYKHSYDFFGLSFNKIKSSLQVFSPEGAVDVMFPVFRRKDFQPDVDFSKSLTYKYPKSAQAEEYRGFVGLDLTMKKEDKYDSKLFNNDFEFKPSIVNYPGITKEEEANLIQFIETSKANKAEVLITIAPSLPSLIDKKYNVFYSYIKQICDNNNVKLVDFNLLWKEIGLSQNDFKDGSHLNQKGAIKVSKYLAHFIKNNYTLETRENNLEWVNEQPISVESYIRNSFNKESIAINKALTDSLIVERFGIYVEPNYKTFVLKLNNNLTESIVNKYKMGIYAFLYDEDLDKLSEEAKNKKKKHEAVNFNMYLKTINNSKFIIKRVNTSADKFSKLKIFLFDINGFKGVIGEALEIDDYKVMETVEK